MFGISTAVSTVKWGDVSAQNVNYAVSNIIAKQELKKWNLPYQVISDKVEYKVTSLSKHLKKAAVQIPLLLRRAHQMSPTYRRNISKFLELQQHETQSAEGRGESDAQNASFDINSSEMPGYMQETTSQAKGAWFRLRNSSSRI